MIISCMSSSGRILGILTHTWKNMAIILQDRYWCQSATRFQNRDLTMSYFITSGWVMKVVMSSNHPSVWWCDLKIMYSDKIREREPGFPSQAVHSKNLCASLLNFYIASLCFPLAVVQEHQGAIRDVIFGHWSCNICRGGSHWWRVSGSVTSPQSYPAAEYFQQ
jgi:hypothetical protein